MSDEMLLASVETSIHFSRQEDGSDCICARCKKFGHPHAYGVGLEMGSSGYHDLVQEAIYHLPYKYEGRRVRVSIELIDDGPAAPADTTEDKDAALEAEAGE